MHVPLTTLATLHGLPGGVAEHRFAPPRRWRFDLCWPSAMLALEVNGGLWVRGRHSRAKGQESDYEKHAHATLLGWRVIWASTRQVESGEAWEWVKRAMNETQLRRLSLID